ncbi:MAG: DUF3108 domain-containing protein [Rhodospirillaceae bacterium]|nr:DUF3108 domain-containing protein [Rhodospirillaceae bacterium]
MAGWRGHLSYIADNGNVRGMEDFVVRTAPDGARSMTVTCRILDTDVWRACVLAVDAGFRPTEAYVRVTEAGCELGSARFVFGARAAQADTVDGRGTPGHSVVDLDGRVEGFGAHPVAADSWHVATLDLSKTGMAQTVTPFFACSLSYNGADAPALVRNDLNLTVHGRETVTVPAGTFACLHFSIDDSFRPPERQRRYHVWCSDDGHFHFVKGRAFGFKPTLYVLDRWEAIP